MAEAWLSGPIDGIDGYLMPAAHAFVQARAELAAACGGLGAVELQARPGGAASLAFHLRHVAGSTDRLLTYARGEALSVSQRAAAKDEEAAAVTTDAGPLLGALSVAIDSALQQLRLTPRESLLDARAVGRAGLPSTVIGLLFHAAEHAQRHAGQAIVTARVVRAAGVP
jgi:uncharacterized damage-inducible protein DinB